MPKIKPPVQPQEEIAFLLTDCCMWEKNKKEGTHYPHSIEVVNMETGTVHYIRSGSIISLLSGQITEARNQDDYNKI